jgi:hypothetical protein
MRRAVLRVVLLLAALAVAGVVLPSPATAIPGFSDCKDAPTPEVPGRGIAGFFDQGPAVPPPQADPFAPGSNTTIYEQYGYAGLRWHTYDLGCGPDAMRQPDAVIGTAMSNWLMQAPIALTALTGSLTEVAFEPTFLGSFDAVTARVSTALHDSLFASWVPAVIALLGAVIIFKARSSALATTAGAIGWTLMVVLVTTALFRWPMQAGQAADATVTGTLGAVVSRLDGRGPDVDPGTAVASNVTESIFYRAWLAGNLGSPDTATAERYGPELFKAGALTWQEASALEADPERGKQIVEEKQQAWKDVADTIQDEDPEAYEYLTGRRSETRIGYAILSTLAAFLALPFLLVSALLLLGCFLIVRLGVMLFPAFATLGVFPATRGLVLGLVQTVGAAVVNAIIFGVGAGVTVAVLGILFHPGGGAPGWLGLVLMPVFSFIMWVALRPFRRLTSMVSADREHFGGMAGATGAAARTGGHWAKRITTAGISAATGGAAAGAAVAMAQDAGPGSQPPDRAEARTTPSPITPPVALPSPSAASVSQADSPEERASSTTARPIDVASQPAPSVPVTRGAVRPASHEVRALHPSFTSAAPSDGAAPAPTEAEWFDGEEVYTIYRPSVDDAESTA